MYVDQSMSICCKYSFVWNFLLHSFEYAVNCSKRRYSSNIYFTSLLKKIADRFELINPHVDNLVFYSI